MRDKFEYTDEPWQDEMLESAKCAGFRYDGHGSWSCDLLTADLLRFMCAIKTAERERWIDAVMAELDSNGQAHAIVAAATRA